MRRRGERWAQSRERTERETCTLRCTRAKKRKRERKRESEWERESAHAGDVAQGVPLYRAQERSRKRKTCHSALPFKTLKIIIAFFFSDILHSAITSDQFSAATWAFSMRIPRRVHAGSSPGPLALPQSKFYRSRVTISSVRKYVRDENINFELISIPERKLLVCTLLRMSYIIIFSVSV